ncbi:MAG: hypothetical protein ACXABY_23560 [Candidatus Thorarchaeota archaeon]|jgi:hypothetical protein
MNRFLILVVALMLFGCDHHDSKHRSSAPALAPDVSIDGVIITFWDTLTEDERQNIIDQIRAELVAWETSHGYQVAQLSIEVIIGGSVEVSVTDDGLLLSITSSHHVPPGSLKNGLCQMFSDAC